MSHSLRQMGLVLAATVSGSMVGGFLLASGYMRSLSFEPRCARGGARWQATASRQPVTLRPLNGLHRHEISVDQLAALTDPAHEPAWIPTRRGLLASRVNRHTIWDVIGLRDGYRVTAVNGHALEGSDAVARLHRVVADAFGVILTVSPPGELTPPFDITLAPTVDDRRVAPLYLQRGTHRVIERAANAELVLGPGIAIEPEVRGWETVGFRLTQVPERGFIAHLGLLPRDVVLGVNGRRVDSPARMMEAYQVLSDAPFWVVNVVRNGEPFDLEVRVIDKPSDTTRVTHEL